MQTNNKLAKSVRLALMFGAAMTFTGVAVAQDTNADEEETKVERIQVTGSKIARPGELSATPLTVISGDGLVDAGVVNVADLLHRMPSTLVGISPDTSNSTVFASGLNNTDLRGLGSNRTLVLVNGRRFISGAPGSGAVDLNNIPTAMIERVEISTGGASAVYGSDAVAGVVNIVTKKNYDGVSLDVTTIRPFDSGGEEDFVSLTFGSSGGKANFVTNLSVTKSGQLSAMDRDYLRNSPIVLKNLNTETGEKLVDSPANAILWGYGEQRMAQYGSTTSLHGGDGIGIFNPDGSFRDFDYGEKLPGTLTSGRQDYVGPGDGYSFSENTWYRTPLDRINFVSHMNYEFNQNHALNLEVNFAKTDAYGESSPAFLAFKVHGDNAFLDDAGRAYVEEAGGVVTGALLASDFGNRKYSQERTLARAAIGLEGSLGSSGNWLYDLYATSAHVQSDTEWYGEMFENRFYQAVDVVEVDGVIQCRDTSDGCIPLNVFGSNQYSQEAYNWVSTDAMRRASIEQHVIAGTVTGDVFELPAGYVASAFSLEWRQEKARTMPDPAMREGLLFGNQSEPLAGSFEVAEASAEFSIPLLYGLPFVDDLTLELAGRVMDYSTSGFDKAWKMGFNWQVNDDLKVRLNRSKSVRAPNIGELYSPPGQTFVSLVDVCATSRNDMLNPEHKEQILANCAAQGIPEDFEPSADWHGATNSGYNIGNTELENEVAHDVTVGFVYKPSFLDNFSVTVDYWQFKLNNSITSVGANTLINLCYRSSTLDNPYCPLIERDPTTHEITNFYQKPVNAAYSSISGYDIEAAYGFETEFGDFDFRLIGTYLHERKSNATGLEEDEIVSTGEQARPRWRHRFITSYSTGDFSAVLSMTYRHATVGDREWSENQNNYNDIPSYTQFDLTTRYNVTQDLQVRFGLLNMFDRNPPRTPYAYDNGAYYDLLGRRATVGINYSF